MVEISIYVVFCWTINNVSFNVLMNSILFYASKNTFRFYLLNRRDYIEYNCLQL